MSTETHDHDDGAWEPCPAGELQRLVGRLADERRHRRMVTVSQWTAGTTLAVLLLVAGSFVVSQFSENTFGGIACSEVAAQLAAYQADALDAERTEKIGVHLKKCSMCGAEYDEMNSKPVDPAEAKRAPGRRAPLPALVATFFHAGRR